MNESENPQKKAIRLLNRQLEELQTVRALNHLESKFKVWQDTTMRVLERFLSKENPHTLRFADIDFFSMELDTDPYGYAPADYVSRKDTREFQEGCRMAEETLKAAIRDVEDFGVYEEQLKPPSNKKSRGRNGGGITQTFNAPVSIHNMAMAADDAIQKIGDMGHNTGASLKEIADLLQHSEELSPREVKEGLAHIEAVALEVRKPEKERNWKTILERGECILSLANKATDLTAKLAPYTPAIFTWIEQAKHWIK